MGKVTGEIIKKAGSCSDAGQSGTVDNLFSPEADSGYFHFDVQSCTAKASGALLLYASGVKIGKDARGLVSLNGASEVFKVTQVGGIPAVSAP
jgi:hypothetical protein